MLPTRLVVGEGYTFGRILAQLMTRIPVRMKLNTTEAICAKHLQLKYMRTMEAPRTNTHSLIFQKSGRLNRHRDEHMLLSQKS